MEDNIFDYSAAPSKHETNHSSHTPATNGKQNFITNPSSGTKLSSSSSSSSHLSTSGNKSSLSSSSSSSFSSKGHTRTPSRTESMDDGELSVSMINPVVSPLQGTKITMELTKVLPPGSSVKVGGKLVNIHPSDDNPNEVSFISPPLPSGSKVIQITMPNGKITNLDGLLIYEELMSPTQFYSSSVPDTRSSAPSASSSGGGGRVWGKRG